ncbi:sodium:solute symporter family transporter [Peredibacter sp. HCB2-198]|uniref:sodium:solute symporter family transporter n=1 Tax=Peredibacter sp. HCB2-198 TaxID=3383025 RepID=UPI0038B5C49E
MNFQIIDWVFIIGYIVVVFWIAIKSRDDMHESELKTPEAIAQEKYMANRSLTFLESICSIIATEVSALTFIGIPAVAFKGDYTFIQIYMGAIAARFVIAVVFLPQVYDKGLTIYEVMAKHTGLPSGQRTVAIFYSLSKVVSVGVRLFSGSIMVATFFNVNIYIGLTAVTLLTLIYIQIGGLKAVVRTDMLQMSLFVIGGVLAHMLIPQTANQSWGDMMSLAQAAGKTSFLNFENPWPFLIGLAGGFLFDMSTHGVDQDFAQRITANKKLRHGQYAIFFSSFVSISVGLLFLSVGSLLWAYYQTHPMPNVAGADYLFPHFIVNYFPLGLRGVMVAGVLAATMSVLDSTINALCATSYNDIFPNRDKKKMSYYGIIDSIIWGVGILTIAIIASKSEGLLYLGLKAQSWTGGTLLALFTSKVIFKKQFHYQLSPASVVGAYICGMGGVFLNTQVLAWDWNLNVYWGFSLSLLFLKIYSALKPAPRG